MTEGTAQTWFASASTRVGRVIYECVTRVDAEGLDELAKLDLRGPLILAANHLSNADPPLVACWLSPALGRTIRWMTKEEALTWPVAGWFMRANGAFGVARDAGDIEGFRRAKRILEAGEVLSVFPEGTRSTTGSLQRAKDGATLLALRTATPILPIGIWGSERVWPRSRRLFRPGGRIHVKVGRPFMLDRRMGANDRPEPLSAVTSRLMGEIAALLPPSYRGVYWDAPRDVGSD